MGEILSLEPDLHLRVMHMDPGVTFAQHFYEGASEILHVLLANKDTCLGPTEVWATPLIQDSFHYFLMSAPKAIKVSNLHDAQWEILAIFGSLQNPDFIQISGPKNIL